MSKASELLKRVADEFRTYGFEGEQKWEDQLGLTKDNKSYQVKHEKYDFLELFGYQVFLQEVCRRNGSEGNISVDISIYNYHRGCGTRLVKERVNINMSDKAISNRIKKIVEAWDIITN